MRFSYDVFLSILHALDDYIYQGLHLKTTQITLQGLNLWYEQKPAIWEKHFCLERDSGNPDSGPFAVTPNQLKEIL